LSLVDFTVDSKHAAVMCEGADCMCNAKSYQTFKRTETISVCSATSYYVSCHFEIGIT